jgi:hypothetical protein
VTINGDWKAYVPGLVADAGGNLKMIYGGGRYSATQNTGTITVAKNAWHSLEVKVSASAGAAQAWLDGVQDVNLTGLTIIPTGANAIAIGLDGGSGTIYVDDISVGNSYSGNPTSSLAVRHPYPTNRTAMYVQCYLWGAAPTDVLVSSIDGTPFSTITNPSGYQAPLLQLTSLAAGNHALQVQLRTSGGAARQTYTETIVAFGGTPTVSIDQNNNLVEGGHKVFPITNWFEGAVGIDYWQNNGYVNAAGWTVDWQSGSNYSPTTFNTFLNNLNVGMPVIAPTSGRIDTGACASFNTSACATAFGTYASTFTNNSHVFGWSGFDEASVNNISIATMQASMNAVHSNDPNHPFFYDDATAPYLHLEWYYPNQVSDVYSSDNYPICYHNQFSSWGKSVSSWVSMLDRETRANYGMTPNVVVLEPWKGYSPPASDCTNITAASIYNEAWLSVIHGRKGITWYDNGSDSGNNYTPVCANGSAVNCFPANPSSHIGKFTAAVAAITADSLLAGPGPNNRTVTSNQTTNATVSAVGTRVDASVSDEGTHTWVFAARLTDIIANPADASAPPLSTTLTVSGFSGSGTATVFGESRTVPVVNGAITDSFSPYQVHIYQITDSGPAAPTNLTANPR